MVENFPQHPRVLGSSEADGLAAPAHACSCERTDRVGHDSEDSGPVQRLRNAGMT